MRTLSRILSGLAIQRSYCQFLSKEDGNGGIQKDIDGGETSSAVAMIESLKKGLRYSCNLKECFGRFEMGSSD
jgi:hypothetical protein